MTTSELLNSATPDTAVAPRGAVSLRNNNVTRMYAYKFSGRSIRQADDGGVADRVLIEIPVTSFLEGRIVVGLDGGYVRNWEWTKRGATCFYRSGHARSTARSGHYSNDGTRASLTTTPPPPPFRPPLRDTPEILMLPFFDTAA
jgi:hypothetical protein